MLPPLLGSKPEMHSDDFNEDFLNKSIWNLRCALSMNYPLHCRVGWLFMKLNIAVWHTNYSRLVPPPIKWYKALNSASKGRSVIVFRACMDITNCNTVFQSRNAMPGGTAYGGEYGLGMSAVHETGHWLGLLHTFQDGCGSSGMPLPDYCAACLWAFSCGSGLHLALGLLRLPESKAFTRNVFIEHVKNKSVYYAVTSLASWECPILWCLMSAVA